MLVTGKAGKEVGRHGLVLAAVLAAKGVNRRD